jgi:hypothetical protein
VKDCYSVCDFGYDGAVVYGPYEESEALRRFPNDPVVRLVHGKFEPCYPDLDDPTDERGVTMRARSYAVLARAVEEGAAHGVRRFYTHRDDAPDEATRNALADEVADAVVNEVGEWFDFEAPDA